VHVKELRRRRHLRQLMKHEDDTDIVKAEPVI
jgi:hypothetical protein